MERRTVGPCFLYAVGLALCCCGGQGEDRDDTHQPFFGEYSAEDSTAALVGPHEESHTGMVLSRAGDVDGDGLGDFLVSAHGRDRCFEDTEECWDIAGGAYLVRGSVSGTVKIEEVATAVLMGSTEGHLSGYHLSGNGDTNGDGFSDILVDDGDAALLLGPISGVLGLDEADTNFLADWDEFALVSDLSGDGMSDVVLCSGEQALVYESPFDGDYLDYEANSFIGGLDNGGSWTDDSPLSTAGDVDGDGLHDLLIGRPGDDSHDQDAGVTWLLLSPIAHSTNVQDADAEFYGHEENLGAGSAVACAGDVDGDGYDDVLLGSERTEDSSLEGAVFLFLCPVAGEQDLEAADARFHGPGRDCHSLGESIDGAGDVDGDGHDDLLIGGGNGYAWLVLGPVYGNRELDNADAVLHGSESLGNGFFGSEVAGAGDVDGDGLADLLVGDDLHNDSWNGDAGWRSGAAFLFTAATLYGE